MKHSVLVSYVPAFENDPMRHYVQRDGRAYVTTILADVRDSDELILCFEPSNLVSRLAETGQTIPGPVMDLSQICRQVRGQSRKEFRGGKEPWVGTNLIHPAYAGRAERLAEIQRALMGLAQMPESDLDELMLELVQNVATLADDLLNALKKDETEWARLCDVEVKIHQVCLTTQLRGIPYDRKLAANWLADLDQQIYRHRNALQLQFGIFSTSQHQRIADELKKLEELELPNLNLDSRDYYALLKRHASKSNPHPLIQSLYLERRATLDKRVLNTLCAQKGKRFYPTFETMGTVTGRILMRETNLQNLRKQYRQVVTADRNKDLVYVDFDHFEARILAHVSEDPKLIEDINRGRFYEHLGSKILSEIDRETWKVIFFVYVYGPLSRDWRKLAKNVFNDGDLAPSIEKAFSRYPRLRAYREEIEVAALAQGRVSSLLGNHRKVPEGSARVPPWALSQIVQGTASLILKEAICAACAIDGVEFLIPMHDAALFQLPSAQRQPLADQIKLKFENAMGKYCGRVTPSATEKAFAQ